MKNKANEVGAYNGGKRPLFRDDLMKINITTNGSSTEADIVWL